MTTWDIQGHLKGMDAWSPALNSNVTKAVERSKCLAEPAVGCSVSESFTPVPFSLTHPASTSATTNPVPLIHQLPNEGPSCSTLSRWYLCLATSANAGAVLNNSPMRYLRPERTQ